MLLVFIIKLYDIKCYALVFYRKMLNILFIFNFYLLYILTSSLLYSKSLLHTPSPPIYSISVQKWAVPHLRHQQDMANQVTVSLSTSSFIENDISFHDFIFCLKLSCFVNLLFWTGSQEEKL